MPAVQSGWARPSAGRLKRPRISQLSPITLVIILLNVPNLNMPGIFFLLNKTNVAITMNIKIRNAKSRRLLVFLYKPCYLVATHLFIERI